MKHRLAIAMGMRTVTVRRLGIADVSTTVLTSTLAGLAADALFTGAPLRAGGDGIGRIERHFQNPIRRAKT